MPVVTEKKAARKVIDSVVEKNASMAIFCTASHWNTEAILLAAQKFCDAHGMESIPLAIAMTFNYPHMPQAQRVTHSRNAKLGFQSIMDHLHILCDSPDSPYRNIVVLPHLDHADPERDAWALTEGTKYLASVMFDAQRYPSDENAAMTRDYVKRYGKDIMIEGIMEELTVADKHAAGGSSSDGYLERAEAYVRSTGIDFLVADLGTEQQSSKSDAHYLTERAKGLTSVLGRKMLVLHGTSSLDDGQMKGLSGDGVVRVNMWTKIAREAGKFAAAGLFHRAEQLFCNDFESIESNRYIMDSIDKASDMMCEVLGALNYANFARL